MSGTSTRWDTRASSTRVAFAVVFLWVLGAAGTRLFGVWLAVGGTAVTLGVALLLFDPRAARQLLQPSLRLIMIGVAAGGFMIAVTYLAYPVLIRLVPWIATDTAYLYSEFRSPSLIIATVALMPVILGEELVWRGMVQAGLMTRLGLVPGVIVAALIYALAHAPLGSPVLVIVALACALFWGALRAASSSLVPALIAHLLWDFVVLLWLPLDWAQL